MSRSKSFLSGVSLGYASQVITVAVGFWLVPFLLFRIGQQEYGLWLVGTQILFYLGMLDFGVVALLPRETAFATGRARSIEDATDLPVIIGQTARIVAWQTPLVALAAIIAWFIIPSEWEPLRHPIGVVLVAFVLAFPLRIFGAVLNGLQDFGFLGKTSIVAYVASTALTVGLVLAGMGLYALAFGWAALQLIVAAASWYRLHTHFPGVMPNSLPKLRHDMARVRLKQGFWVSANQIAQVLLNGTDILIIGKLIGPAAVVPFVITGKLIGVLANQPQMLAQLAVSPLSQMRMGESRERLTQVCIALGQAMLMLSGMVVCVVLVVNQGFIGRWVGAGQFGGFGLTALILVSMLLRHWNLTIGYALFSFGRERRLCVTALLDGLVSVSAMTVFIWGYGLIGAPLGIITGVCLVSLPANLSALARESNLSLWALVRPLGPWFSRFVLLALGAGALVRVWMPSTLPWLAVTAVGVALVYAAVMFPLALRAPLGLYVRPRLLPIRARFFRALRLKPSV
jgi:O-antigen/teichoic acid export membrane protein